MNTFKLKHTFDDGEGSAYNSKTVKTFQAEKLEDVFFQLTDFLKGVGYVFDGQVGIVEEQWPEFCGETGTQLEFNLFTNK